MIQRLLTTAATVALALTVAVLTPASAAPVLHQIASGFNQPLAISFSADGRQFVVEQGGRIVELLGNGSQRNFMTVPKIVVGGEKGLLNLAFPKDFATTRRFYVYCTSADANGRLQVEIRRYLTIAGGTQLGDPNQGRSCSPIQSISKTTTAAGWLSVPMDICISGLATAARATTPPTTLKTSARC